jgi:adenylate cyclase
MFPLPEVGTDWNGRRCEAGASMSDIFISYACQNEALAKAAADLLRAQGDGVWRDDELPAHRACCDVIEERIQAAKAVVVLW